MWELIWDVVLWGLIGAAFTIGVLSALVLVRSFTGPSANERVNSCSLDKMEERNEIGRRQLAALEGIWSELARIRVDADAGMRLLQDYEDDTDIGGEAGGA